MKKLFFILIYFSIAVNIFSFDFIGNWDANFKTIETEDSISEDRSIKIKFNRDNCIFYRENTQSIYNYKVDENFFFIANSGYEIKIENDDKFILIPRHESDVEYIVFIREWYEWW